MNSKLIKSVFIGILSFPLLNACSNSNFSGASGLAKGSKPKPKPDSEQTTQVELESTDGGVSLNKHEAVFAVRNLSCTLCHANVEANIISDFGASADENSSAIAFASIMHVRNIGARDNSKTSISGDFLIPKTDISVYSAGTTSGKSNCTPAGSLSSGPYSKIPLLANLSDCLGSTIVWGASSQKFVEKSKISINPINSPEEIRKMVDKEILAKQKYALTKESVLTGIPTDLSKGIKLTGKFNCEGAVVFDAPVYIKAADITSTRGCRIYSTGSIFIFGGLKVSGSDASNIQLMSPTYVGLDVSQAVLNGRFGKTGTYWVQSITFSIGSWLTAYNAITQDMTTSGASADGGEGNIDYSRIAISAPIVFARNKGTTSGVIIAEFFLGPIGNTKFKFDTVFRSATTTVSIFPEISKPLVEIE